MIGAENGNDLSVEKIVDKKELAKQRRNFLRREQYHAEKLIREREMGIDPVAVNGEREQRKRKRNVAKDDVYDAVKRHEASSENKHHEKMDEDAECFRNYVDGHLVFEVCCICGFEGPVVEFVALDDVMDFLEKANYVKSFVDYCNKLSRGKSQDKCFLLAIESEFTKEGVLRGFRKLCGECFREMRSKKTSKKTYVSDDEERSDEEVDDSEDGSCDDEIVDSGCSLKSRNVICAKAYPRMPKGTLFLGLFQGAIPSQLDGLTMVEHSMISL